MDFKSFKKNVDKYRSDKSSKRVVITKEQEEFIILCRQGDYPVPTRKMAELWGELGWGKITHFAIHERIQRLKSQGKLK